MENSETSSELLENVVISDVPTPQYVLQRMPENSQLLGTELLQHHNGLVVDLAGTDFIPVSYPSEALLSQDLTEEDRNLAAALVAVQLSQHQKQQQLHETGLPSLVPNAGLDNKILEEQQLILSDKEASISNGYLQIVGSDNIYVEKQAVPKIVNSRFVSFAANNSEKSEDEKRGSDGDHRTSRKSLPHKKRISRKLKKQNPTKIQCNLCEQTFTSNDDFAQHEILCQTTITPVHNTAFSCQICNANFHDQLRFFEHLKSHYEPNNQVQSTAIEKNEVDSEKDNIFSTLLNLTCIQCNKTFRRQKAFETHMKEVHHKDDLNEFSETEDLMEGINVVVDHETNSDNDTKAWYREDELHQTEEDLKELEAEEHVCHICKQPFPLRAILLQHLVTCRADTGNTEPTAPSLVKRKNKKKGSMHCRECDRVFTHRNSLVYHMRSHSGIRPHQCDQCGKSFFASSALKVHLRLHSGDKPYHCQDCGKNFRQWGDLKYHMTSLHSNEKQFQCEYCGKDFARKYSLIVHRRIHTGEKNYKCEFCGKTFRASSYLQNHRRIHTGEKPHECGICGKPFRVRSDMKRHQKTHSKRSILGKPMRYNAPQNNDKVIKSETGSNLSEDVYELNVNVEEAENAPGGQILSYDHDQLETVRDGGTLYQGHQLLLVSYSTDVPIRSVDSASTWIQTGS
ncbi:zinc finger protein 354A-like [Tribolium castaneum]|uniref:zinc finger protein 354A-like n=1 Tax=Tribolium castaneum TaxID=7070 RepID=UPI00046C085E|nr:PREDICTED: zinc finger protein 354A-like [Tribolium castaneum]|eukprot:XP_008191697.1 PREDICTED: zinc finger protein 354A-like [Tribolium castaneum]